MFAVALMLSCSSNTNPDQTETSVKEYVFNYVQTTGIDTRIVHNGSITNILYHENSDKKDLDLLLALKWHILQPSAGDSSKITVVGKLYDKIKTTPKCNGCPAPEIYREFELIDWYIKAPFKQITYNGKPAQGLMDDPELIKVIDRDVLEKDDFKSFKGLNQYDLSKYLRNNL